MGQARRWFVLTFPSHLLLLPPYYSRSLERMSRYLGLSNAGDVAPPPKNVRGKRGGRARRAGSATTFSSQGIGIDHRAFQCSPAFLCEGRPTPGKWVSVPWRAEPATARSPKKGGRGRASQRALESPVPTQ